MRRPQSLADRRSASRAHFAPCVLALLDPRPSAAANVLNPLRSEDEAFRFLLYAIAVIGAIVVLILILRAIF